MRTSAVRKAVLLLGFRTTTWNSPSATAPSSSSVAAAREPVPSLRAAELLEPLHLAAPADRDLAADLAEALVVAGDPRGRRLAAELLADDPLDGRLMALARGLRSLDPGAAQRALDGR